MKKKAKRALIVDDSLMMRKQMSKTLANEGFEIIEAKSGGELLNSKKFKPSIATTGLLDYLVPDLFVLDVELGDMNGIEILVELKNHHTFKDIPAIVVSTHQDKETIINAISAGAADYVVKTGKFLEILAAKARRIFIHELSTFDITLESEFEWIKFGHKEMALALITVYNLSSHEPISTQEFVDLVICLQNNTKRYDWIFPLNDYNVAIVLPLVSIQDIFKIKNRLLEKVKTFIESLKVPVDMQIGFSHYPTNATSVEELISVAESQITRVEKDTG